MHPEQIEKFNTLGWCSHSDPAMTRAIEVLVDEVLEFSHAIFEQFVPALKGLDAKSDYLATSVSKMAQTDRRKLSFVYDGIKNLPGFNIDYFCHITLLYPEALRNALRVCAINILNLDKILRNVTLLPPGCQVGNRVV